MAGQKLSPRQKMINMMYLVLTALLALNISSEILQAFESLRNSLATSTQNVGEKNKSLAAGISELITEYEKKGNESKSYVKPLISEVMGETQKMIAFLGELEKSLEEIAQKDPETGELINKEERDRNYTFWMGNDAANDGRGDGKARELHQQLDAYIAWANAMFEKHDSDHPKNRFSPIAIEPKDDPTASHSENKDDPWEYFTFHNKPVVADLAMVEKYKMDVKSVETEMLGLMESLVGKAKFKIDKLKALEAPMAYSVAAGMKYETKLMVGMYSDDVKPEFQGSGISIDEGGNTATMTIMANGNVIPSGQATGIQRYSAMIKVPTSNGEWEELPIEGEFMVRRPEAVYESRAVQLLYRNCGNQISVDVPALEDSYNPDFNSSQGGRVIQSRTDKKDVVISPTGNQFKLNLFSNTNGQRLKIDEKVFRVITPPPPSLEIHTRTGRYDFKKALTKRDGVKVKIVPDREFMQSFPKDARYGCAKITLSLQSGFSGAPRHVATLTGNLMDGINVQFYQGMMKNASPGDKAIIEVESVYRLNFEGKKINDTGLDRYKTTFVIPLK